MISVIDCHASYSSHMCVCVCDMNWGLFIVIHIFVLGYSHCYEYQYFITNIICYKILLLNYGTSYHPCLSMHPAVTCFNVQFNKFWSNQDVLKI